MCQDAAASRSATRPLPFTVCRMIYRMVEGMQLEDWKRLSGLTGLTLRGARESHRGTLVATLPRLTTLRSLVISDKSPRWLPAAGAPAHGRVGAICQVPNF